MGRRRSGPEGGSDSQETNPRGFSDGEEGMAPHDTDELRNAYKARWYEWKAGRCLEKSAVLYATTEAKAYEKIQRILRADGRGYSGLFIRLER